MIAYRNLHAAQKYGDSLRNYRQKEAGGAVDAVKNGGTGLLGRGVVIKTTGKTTPAKMVAKEYAQQSYQNR